MALIHGGKIGQTCESPDDATCASITTHECRRQRLPRRHQDLRTYDAAAVGAQPIAVSQSWWLSGLTASGILGRCCHRQRIADRVWNYLSHVLRLSRPHKQFDDSRTGGTFGNNCWASCRSGGAIFRCSFPLGFRCHGENELCNSQKKKRTRNDLKTPQAWVFLNSFSSHFRD